MRVEVAYERPGNKAVGYVGGGDRCVHGDRVAIACEWVGYYSELMRTGGMALRHPLGLRALSKLTPRIFSAKMLDGDRRIRAAVDAADGEMV
jgi:hypothetical protein